MSQANTTKMIDATAKAANMFGDSIVGNAPNDRHMSKVQCTA